VIKRFAQHRVAANLLMVMMILAGIWAIRTMPSMLDPPMHFPMVHVQVSWVGAAAEDIEALVTTPIEQQLRTINDLKEINSRTVNGFTSITAHFNYDADIGQALDEVKQRVGSIRNLPPAIEPPIVRREIDLEPISQLLITTEGTLRELIPLARSFEKELLSRGIEGVRYDGLPAEEIALLFSGQRLQQLGMTLDELAREVSRVSQNVPAGAVGRGHGSRQLRSLDQRRDPMSFEQLQLESDGQLMRVGDVAEVVRRPQRGQPYLRSDGKSAIQMMLWRSTAADALLAERIAKGWLNDVQPTLPAGVEVTEINNIWRLLGAQLDMIMKNALSGLVLVIVVLFLFLNVRAGLWVTIGIPVSFLLGLSLFYLIFGYGISIIALIGFVVALGIVVDDAIVVGEDIVTHHEQGASPAQAATAGAQRMWLPVVTSSLTTMAAFIPLLIIGGGMGDVVLALPTVLLCIIVASLVECFCVLPGHLRASLEKMDPTAPPGRVEQWRRRFDVGFKRFRDERFTPLLKKALDYPVATLSAACGGILIAMSLIASQHVGFNMVMGFDIESVEANVEFSSSASEQEKLDFVAHLEETLDQVNQSAGNRDVLGWTAIYNLATFNNDRLQGEQYASVAGQYAYEEDRSIAPDEFAERWRSLVARPPYVEQFTLGVEGGANNGNADITLMLRGHDIDRLKQGAEEVSDLLRGYPGVSNVTDNLPYGKEQIIFEMTPRGRSLGLSAEEIGRQLRAAYSGSRVQIFNEEQTELEVRVMLPDSERDSLGSLQRFPIRTAQGTFVPLGNVATLYNRRGIDVIRHSDTQLAVAVRADVDPNVNNAISIVSDISSNRLDPILDRHDLTFGLGGKSEQDQVIMTTMALGAVLTLVFIYLILAWVFSSYLWPLAIMAAIPFGLTGAVFGHWVTGWEIGAMSMLAFFSLTGIVVNDSIVLVSFLRRDVDAGIPIKDALTEAARSRFRAVVLTSLTTIAGLSPLMFETSTMSMYVAPIAVTVCFGLALGTTLVLLVIPALILLLERGKGRALKLKQRLVEPSDEIPVDSLHS
jgi:multidrug efflux pump subunit AcrB